MKVAPTLLLFCLSLLAYSSSVARPNEERHPDAIVSHIRREPVGSTAIAAIGYSKRRHALEIEFVNGAIYRYLEVSPPIYRELMAADSKARFYDRNIRGKYRSLHVRPRKK
jgi:hypothetical protein